MLARWLAAAISSSRAGAARRLRGKTIAMAAFVGPFRRTLSWWAPAVVLVLVAVIWVRKFGWPWTPRGWLIWLEILLVGLAWSAVRSQRKLKSLLLAHADQLSRKIDWLQQRLSEQQPTSERQQMKDSLIDLTEACKRIEQVPSWPIDPSIRRRFSVGNIALLLPFITFALSVSK